MSINKVTFIILIYFVYQVVSNKNNAENQEAEIGKNIILHCKSTDDFHNFMFWYLFNTDTVIGPKNDFNNVKYKYEILSGNLTIRGVTQNDAGIYSCVSDGVDKRDILVHSVNLILKGWKENDYSAAPTTAHSETGNLWKVSAILGSIFVFLVIILVGLHVYHKEKPNYFDIIEQNDDDEDSTEELFTREPSTSGIKIIPDKNGTADNFQKVYTAINMKNT